MRLSRRAVLRGLGAAVALPFLDVMRPARATSTPAPRRFALVYLPNGIHPDHYTPTGTGTAWTASRVLQPLEPHRSALTVLTGLDNLPYLSDGHGGPMTSALTGERLVERAPEGAWNGRSIDQVLADRLGSATPVRSLELTSEPNLSCFGSTTCAYYENVSWSDATTPVPREGDPRAVFERLFGAIGVDSATAAQRRRRDLLVVDAVREDAARLSPKLGVEDRGVLDAFLESLFAVERQIDAPVVAETCDVDLADVIPPDALVPPYTVQRHTDLMADLIGLAFQCDLTRIATWQLGVERSRRAYPDLGVPDQHHRASHHGGDPVMLESIARICTWEMTRVERLIGRLATMTGSDGAPLLDHTALVAMAGISEPDRHVHTNVPMVIAGKLGGAITPGRLVAFEGRPLADLWLGLAAGLGVDDLGTFGERGTSPISLA